MVAYLQSLGGEVTVTGADIDTGDGDAAEVAAAPAAGGPASASTDPMEIMTANACLGCHVLQGGSTPMGPAFDGVGARLSAAEIRESILDPAASASPGFEALQAVMPPIFGNQLSAAQLEILVQFLANQQ